MCLWRKKELGFVVIDSAKASKKRDSDRFDRRSKAPVLKSR